MAVPEATLDPGLFRLESRHYFGVPGQNEKRGTEVRRGAAVQFKHQPQINYYRVCVCVRGVEFCVHTSTTLIFCLFSWTRELIGKGTRRRLQRARLCEGDAHVSGGSRRHFLAKLAR